MAHLSSNSMRRACYKGDLTRTEVDYLQDVTAGTASASKAAVLGTNKNLDTIVIADGGLKLGSGAGTAVTSTAAELNVLDGIAANIGAKNGATVAASESITGFKTTVLTCTATPITIADDANVAQYGGVKVYDFPLGAICILGAVVDGALTLGVTGTITDTWEGDVALGTATATTGATLTGTEADILPSVAIAAATSKVGTIGAVPVATVLTESGARWLDGTTTAIDMYLNFVIDDSASHTAGTGTFTGTVTFHWIYLGDH
jgi:hypothetical protein